MSTTRQLGRVEVERWLYRTDKGDYGPVPTDKLLEAIAERKIDLATQVRLMSSDKWSSAAEHALFRNYYEKAKARWEVEDAEKARIERERSFLKKDRQRRVRTRVMLIGGAAVLAIVAWWFWKQSLIEGVSLARAARLRTAPSLPVEVAEAPPPALIPDVRERRVPTLREPEDPINYNVAGVKVGETEQGTVTRMEFGEDGEVQEIDPALLSRVVESARQGVYACAREHVATNPGFTGTNVGFAVASGGLTRITVGAEVKKSPAFQSCVKAALNRVQVPSFEGSERYVTVPIRVEH
ncbi:MAG: hypothetical protein IT385_07095 [Deltaproteobacteria bacterium]|nr:hypothetical protein [Deltaproteobacteria bacterium]